MKSTMLEIERPLDNHCLHMCIHVYVKQSEEEETVWTQCVTPIGAFVFGSIVLQNNSEIAEKSKSVKITKADEIQRSRRSERVCSTAGDRSLPHRPSWPLGPSERWKKGMTCCCRSRASLIF